MGANTADGVSVDRWAEWRAYDSLPAPIREVFARAPFDYAMTKIAPEIRRSLASGRTVRAERQSAVSWIVAQMRAEARFTYGPDHPDVTHPRRGRAVA